MLSRSDVFAFWLYNHPDMFVSVFDRGKEVIYWYSPEKRCFMYQKYSNKVRNEPMKARGLCSSYLRYMKSFDPIYNSCTEKCLFDMT